MGLLSDAIALLQNGKALQALAVSDDEPPLVLKAAADGWYLLHDAAMGDSARRFQRPASAVRTFYRLVGASGLSRAVAGHRYRAMFPDGSSLEWPPIPL